MDQKIPKLTFFEKFGFGLGDTASNFIWGTLNNFMPFFYTDIFGISAKAAGGILLFTRIGDGIMDFFMGAIADRTDTKWGKFRPYLLWMCIPLAVVFILTFTTPNFSMTGKITYAAITYSLLMIFYTAINIPYGAMSGVMTNDPLDRTSLNSFRMGLANFGGFLINLATFPLTIWFGGLASDFDGKNITPAQHDQAAHGYQMTVIAFSIGLIALFLITFFACRERIHPPKGQKNSLLNDLDTLFGNRHWLLMFLVGLVGLTVIIVQGSNRVYYCKYFANIGGGHVDFLGFLDYHPDDTSFFLVLGNVGFILGAICTRFLVKAIGKKYSYIATFTGMAAASALFYWVPPGLENVLSMFVLQFLVNYFAGLNAAVFFSLIADTADFSEWKFNVRNTGIIFSAVTCAQKVGLGIGAWYGSSILDKAGFKANVDQTPVAAHDILLLVSLVPAAGFLFIAIIFNFYGLSEKVLQTIRTDLAARRESGKVAEFKALRFSNLAFGSFLCAGALALILLVQFILWQADYVLPPGAAYGIYGVSLLLVIAAIALGHMALGETAKDTSLTGRNLATGILALCYMGLVVGLGSTWISSEISIFDNWLFALNSLPRA